MEDNMSDNKVMGGRRNVDVLENRFGNRVSRRCHNARCGPSDLLITKCGRNATQRSGKWSTGNEPIGRAHIRAMRIPSLLDPLGHWNQGDFLA